MQPRTSIVSYIPLAGVVLLLWLATVIESQSGAPSPEEDMESCYRTSDPDLSQKLRLEAIKHELLLRLGLDEVPPNPDPETLQPTDDPTFAENYRIAQEVERVHNANQKPCTKLDTHKKNLLAFFPTDIKGYPPTKHPSQDLAFPSKHSKPTTGKHSISGGSNYNEHYRLKFDVAIDSTLSAISHLYAELRLYKLPRFSIFNNKNSLTAEDRVEIRLIVRPENYLDQELPIFVTYEMVRAVDGYVVFNVSKAITEWISRNNNALTGEMELDVLIRSPEPILNGPTFEPSVQFSLEDKISQLVLTVYEDEREKRGAIDPEYATENPRRCEFQCCWRPFVVNFKRDYNWTWIREPESIEFNYCSGECPQGWAVDGYHSRLLDIHRQHVLNENPTAAPEPCCVPDSYEERTFVLNYRNDTLYVVIEDAVVTSCICR